MNTRTLYRPVGLKELLLVSESGWKAFPPRLSWQPIFYPVLNSGYAEQIARDWNTTDEFSGFCGAVTAFDLPQSFLERYPTQNVGGEEHDELWVPAEALEEFNGQIIGPIRLVNAFFGKDFAMPEDESVAAILKTFIR